MLTNIKFIFIIILICTSYFFIPLWSAEPYAVSEREIIASLSEGTYITPTVHKLINTKMKKIPAATTSKEELRFYRLSLMLSALNSAYGVWFQKYSNVDLSQVSLIKPALPDSMFLLGSYVPPEDITGKTTSCTFSSPKRGGSQAGRIY